MNQVFLGIVLIAFGVGAITGNMEAVSLGALNGAKSAVDLAIGLIGYMALFLGLMKVGEEGGLLRLLARAIRPLMVRLFPDVPAEHPAMGAMILNIAANMLGLTNAATPLGIKAMQELNTLNRTPGVATNAMVLFLAINTSGLALLPTGVVGVRAAEGSADPWGILASTLFATASATVAGITAAKLLQRLPMFRAPAPEVETAVGASEAGERAASADAAIANASEAGEHAAAPTAGDASSAHDAAIANASSAREAAVDTAPAEGAAGAASAGSDDAAEESSEAEEPNLVDSLMEVERTAETTWGVLVLRLVLVSTLAILAGPPLVAAFLPSTDPTGVALREFTDVAGDWVIPSLIVALLLYGWSTGVKVYEVFVQGAKEGFQTGVMIIPYLVAILSAVGMFRGSGAMTALTSGLGFVTEPLGVPGEVLPIALVRPLSGSGAFGLMVEQVQAHGPDSYIGYLSTTMVGSTDTTFYVLAVYFGAVGVHRARHAVAAGLTADLTGFLAAALVCQLLFGHLMG